MYDYGALGNMVSLISGFWMNPIIMQDINVLQYAIPFSYAELSATHRPILALIQWKSQKLPTPHPFNPEEAVQLPLLYSIRPGPIRNSLSKDQARILGINIQHKVQQAEDRGAHLSTQVQQELNLWASIIRATIVLGINLEQIDTAYIDDKTISEHLQSAETERCKGETKEASVQNTATVHEAAQTLRNVVANAPNGKFLYYAEKNRVEATFGTSYKQLVDAIFESHIEFQRAHKEPFPKGKTRKDEPNTHYSNDERAEIVLNIFATATHDMKIDYDYLCKIVSPNFQMSYNVPAVPLDKAIVHQWGSNYLNLIRSNLIYNQVLELQKSKNDFKVQQTITETYSRCTTKKTDKVSIIAQRFIDPNNIGDRNSSNVAGKCRKKSHYLFF
jgi:hypothetical protein